MNQAMNEETYEILGQSVEAITSSDDIATNMALEEEIRESEDAKKGDGITAPLKGYILMRPQVRLKTPRTTTLIFPSGRLVSVGAKTEEDGRLSLRKVVRILQKMGYKKAKFSNFKIQNIMARCSVGFPIRLEGLAYAHSKYSRFEPEIFPGLVYRMGSPKCCLLIFVSGRIVFTGAKSRSDIQKAFENIYSVLVDFRQNRPIEASEREEREEEPSRTEPSIPNEQQEESEPFFTFNEPPDGNVDDDDDDDNFDD